MTPTRDKTRNKCGVIQKANGFSFIELIMVIVLLSIASAALISLLGQVVMGVNVNHDAQAANQMAQECSEYLLATRRQAGYNLGGVTDCSVLAAFNGNGPPSVTISAYTGGSGCPGTATCNLVQVSASYATSASQITIMLADY